MLISGHQSNEWCLVSADSNCTWEDIQLLSFKSELTFSQAPQCQCLVLSWKGRLLPHQVRFACLTFSQTVWPLSGNICCIIYVILSFVKTLTAMQSNLLEMCSIVLRCQSLSWIWFNSAQKNSSRILEVFDLLNISLDIACTRETTFTAGGWKNATSYRVLPTCTKASTLREEGSKMPSHV